MTINPSPNRSKPPAFNEMDADAFEEMSCALCEKEPGISKADLYRTKRKPQYGIDVLAERTDGDGIEVASCKCYGKVNKGDIAAWSDDFLTHWDTVWKVKNVHKFILIVATAVNSMQREAEIEIEKVRFAAIGATYEVWGPRQLQERIRHYSGLVSQYLGPEYVARLCGVTPSVESAYPGGSEALSSQVIAQMGALQQALSGEVEKRLDSAFMGILRGNLDTIGNELLELRTGTNWTQLLPETQARVIRLQASLALQRDDMDCARKFADEADAIVKPSEPRLRALLANCEVGAEKGLEILGTPVSRDGVQLQVGLLLECGRVDDANELLRTQQVLKDGHPESERLRAIVALMQGHREEALSLIQHAEEIAPDQPAIQRMGGMIRYASALSPLVTPEWFVYPNPIDFDLVREDDEGRALLLEALSIFEKIVSREQHPGRRKMDETWAIACLCNLRDRIPLADERCKKTLAKDPAHAGAIEWALARGFDFDHSHCIESSRKILERGEGEPNQVLALAWLMVSEGKLQEAEDVVTCYSKPFNTPNLQMVRDKWLADLAAQKSSDSAAKTDKSLSFASRMSFLLEQANRTKDWTPLESFFKELIVAEPPPVTALKVGQLIAAAGYWDAIASNLDSLLSFGTSEAVRIAAFAAFNTRQPNLALKILEDHQSAFPAGVLPHELRVLRINAFALAGDKGAALRHASMLASESTSLSDRLIKADMLVRTGNVAAAVPIIREATKAELFSPIRALGLAQVVALEDPALARSLLRHAKKKGIPEEHSPAAFDLACQLGIENEATSFLEQMGRLAERGTETVKIISLDDLKEQTRLWQESAINLQNSYFDGVLPVHMLAAQANWNLARLFRLPDGDKSSVSPLNPILIRHGARPADVKVGIPITEWRIYLDITGLLIAAQLDLLDLLEQLPHPISISPSLPETLYGLEIKTRHNQPGRIASLKAILQDVEGARITVAELCEETADTIPGLDKHQSAAVNVARGSEGLVVEHHLPKETLGEAIAVFTTILGIVDGLFKAGAIDPEVYADALSRIGIYCNEKGNLPLPGSSVLFVTNTLTVLAEVGLLNAVVDLYRVQIEADFVKMARREIENADDSEKLAGWLTEVRRRIGEGIGAGCYTTLVVADSHGVGEVDNAEEVNPFSTPVMRCLSDILRAPQRLNAVIWIDDRNLTGYERTQTQGNPIVGIYEVLNAMRDACLISDQVQRKILARLRASDALFLPLQPAEILDLLCNAPLHDGKVVETPALAAIRRYMARTLLLQDHLKTDESNEALKGRPLEIQTLMDLRRLAETCIVAQWVKPGATDETRRARSSWIWSALRIERFDRLPLNAGQSAANQTIPALLVCALLTGVFQIEEGRKGGPGFPRRKSYLKWVEDEVLGPRFANDPLQVEESLRILTQLLINLVDFRSGDSDKPEVFAEAKRYIRLIVFLFPEIIRAKLTDNCELCEKLGIKTASVVKVGSMAFGADRFWASLARALSVGHARVRTLKDKRRVEMKKVSARENTVVLKGAVRCQLSDAAFQLLNPSPSQRKRIFEENHAWIDMPESDRQAAIGHIVSSESLTERMHSLEELRRSSAAVHYASLVEKFGASSPITFEDFRPPSADSLLRHLRLANNGAFLDRLEIAAKTLVAEEGPCLAFSRLSGLPVPIPEPVIKAFVSLTEEKRHDALAEVSSAARTPLQLIQVLRLLRIVGHGHDIEISSRLFDHLLGAWLEIGPLFVAVLRWIDASARIDFNWVNLAPTDRLALVWTHADRLTDIIISTGCDPKEATETFSSNHPARPLEQVMWRDRGYLDAVANPDLIEEASILFHGFGYILGTADASHSYSPEQVERLRGAMRVEVDGVHVVSPWLYVNRGNAGNDLGSFFGSRPQGIFESDVDPTENACSQALENIFVQLEQDPRSDISWLAVWAFGRPSLESSLKSRLNGLLEKVDVVGIIRQAQRQEDDHPILILQAIGNCCVRLGDCEARAEVLEQLTQLAAFFATKYPGRPASTVANDALVSVRQLVEGVAAISEDDDIVEGFSRFGESVVSIARAWPAAVPVLREILENVLHMAPAEHTFKMWKSSMVLRSL
jgi:tetratricopeptide (TPR) repeat protein